MNNFITTALIAVIALLVSTQSHVISAQLCHVAFAAGEEKEASIISSGQWANNVSWDASFVIDMCYRDKITAALNWEEGAKMKQEGNQRVELTGLSLNGKKITSLSREVETNTIISVPVPDHDQQPNQFFKFLIATNDVETKTGQTSVAFRFIVYYQSADSSSILVASDVCPDIFVGFTETCVSFVELRPVLEAVGWTSFLLFILFMIIGYTRRTALMSRYEKMERDAHWQGSLGSEIMQLRIVDPASVVHRLTAGLGIVPISKSNEDNNGGVSRIPLGKRRADASSGLRDFSYIHCLTDPSPSRTSSSSSNSNNVLHFESKLIYNRGRHLRSDEPEQFCLIQLLRIIDRPNDYYLVLRSGRVGVSGFTTLIHCPGGEVEGIADFFSQVSSKRADDWEVVDGPINPPQFVIMKMVTDGKSKGSSGADCENQYSNNNHEEQTTIVKTTQQINDSFDEQQSNNDSKTRRLKRSLSVVEPNRSFAAPPSPNHHESSTRNRDLDSDDNNNNNQTFGDGDIPLVQEEEQHHREDDNNAVAVQQQKEKREQEDKEKVIREATEKIQEQQKQQQQQQLEQERKVEEQRRQQQQQQQLEKMQQQQSQTQLQQTLDEERRKLEQERKQFEAIKQQKLDEEKKSLDQMKKNQEQELEAARKKQEQIFKQKQKQEQEKIERERQELEDARQQLELQRREMQAMFEQQQQQQQQTNQHDNNNNEQDQQQDQHSPLSSSSAASPSTGGVFNNTDSNTSSPSPSPKNDPLGETFTFDAHSLKATAMATANNTNNKPSAANNKPRSSSTVSTSSSQKSDYDDEDLVNARPFLGFSVTSRKLENDSKIVVVDSLWTNGPADRAGIKIGDRVSHLWGKRVNSLQEVKNVFRENVCVGERMILHIENDEQEVERRRREIAEEKKRARDDDEDAESMDDEEEEDAIRYSMKMIPILTDDTNFKHNRLYFEVSNSSRLHQ